MALDRTAAQVDIAYMQAAEQPDQQPTQPAKGRGRGYGRPWPKGVSGNPNGSRAFTSWLKSLNADEREMQRAEAWRIVRSRKARPGHKIAALKLLQRLGPPEQAKPRNAADVLSRIASEHRPAVDQAEKINAAEQADKR